MIITFFIGLLVGISIGALGVQIIKPHVGTLFVDKTDPSGKTFLYLDVNREPEKIGELKFVSMEVKEADYFGS